MADNIIRVILQGVNNLGPAFKDAARDASSSLSSINSRLRGTRRESLLTGMSFDDLAASLNRTGGNLDGANKKLVRFQDSLRKFREENKKAVESADDLFNRLGREGKAPRQGGKFQSRDNFVAQENARREAETRAQIAGLKRQADEVISGIRRNYQRTRTEILHGEALLENAQRDAITKRARSVKNKIFEGASPIDDIARGLKRGAGLINQDDRTSTQGVAARVRIEEQNALSEARIKIAAEKSVLEERLRNEKQNRVQEALDVNRSLSDEIKARKAAASRIAEIENGNLAFFIENREKIRRTTLDEIEAEVQARQRKGRDEVARIRLEETQTVNELRAEQREVEKLRPEDGENARREAAARKNEVEERIAAARAAAQQEVNVEDDKVSAFEKSMRARRNAFESTLRSEIDSEKEASNQIISNAKREADEVVKINKDKLAKIESDTRASADRDAAVQRATFNEGSTSSLNEIRSSFLNKRSNIPDIIRQNNADRSNAINNKKGDGNFEFSFVERNAAKVGAALDDLGRGFRGARKGLEDFKGAARDAQTTFAQIGADVGDATKSISQFVNLRWLLVVGFVASLGTVVVELGSALVAIASSAALAAAALGGAFLAGAAAAVPVVGLLVAAFHSLSDAMKVVQLRQQARDSSVQDAKTQADARRRSAEQLSDANYNLKNSIQSVVEAEYNLGESHQRVKDAEKEQTDAVKDLAEARRQAARTIVDATFDERDARLSLREAELGVLDAKQRLLEFERTSRRSTADLTDAQAAVKEAQQRLAAAKAQGDRIEIASAQSNLSVVSNSVNRIKDQIAETATQHQELQLGVKRAQLTEDQARVRQRRSVQDDARVRRQGVEGSPGVRNAVDRLASANRGLRDATHAVFQAEKNVADQKHAVILAHREVRDAIIAVTAANQKLSESQRNAQTQFNKLSPGQKGFVTSLEAFQKTYKKFINPISDIIIGAFSRGLNRAGQLLRDPKIGGELRTLAGEIADIGDKFTKWVVSPEGRKTIEFFIRSAIRNLPGIADAAGKFATALLNIAKAATPLFGHLVSLIDGFGGKAEKATGHTKKLDDFFRTAGKHLDAWIKLAGAVARFFGALIGASAGSGLKMVKGITSAVNDMADKIRKNHKAFSDFFERVRKGLAVLLPVLGKALIQLANAFTSKSFINFTTFMIQTMVPGLLIMIGILGDLTGLLTALFGVPVIGPAAKYVAQIFLGYAAFKRLFPVVNILGTAFKGVIRQLGIMLLRLKLVRIAATFMFGPWGLAILAIIGIVYLLDKKFHFIRPTIEAVGRAAKFVWKWIKDNWREMLGWITYPFTEAWKVIRKIPGWITDAFNGVIKWVRTNWRTLVAILVAVFVPGGILILAIIRFGPRVINVFRNIISWVRNNMGRLLRSAFTFIFSTIPNMIVGFFANVGTRIVNAILGGLGRLGKRIAKSLGIGKNDVDVATAAQKVISGDDQNGLQAGLLHKVFDKASRGDRVSQALVRQIPAGLRRKLRAQGYAGGGTVYASIGSDGPKGTDTVPAWLTPGEWVLNKKQQQKLSRFVGESSDSLKLLLFGETGKNPAALQRQPQGQNAILPNGVELLPHTDSYGSTVWFLKMTDGSYSQVSARAAKRIQQSNGTWLPGYVRRSRSGSPTLSQWAHKPMFHGGGVVSFGMPAARRFAAGGVIASGPVVSSPSGGGNTVNQEFHVQTEGESDWNHVMRLGAQHAQASY